MTQAQFNDISYCKGDRLIYKGKEYEIKQIDFEESLFAINTVDDSENLSWVRCENVVFVSHMA